MRRFLPGRSAQYSRRRGPLMAPWLAFARHPAPPRGPGAPDLRDGSYPNRCKGPRRHCLAAAREPLPVARSDGACAGRHGCYDRTYVRGPVREVGEEGPPRMSVDDEHEVIDSPAALFRHLSEAHGLDEARELDPLTTSVHPWLRRHDDLERAARLAAARRREDGAAPAGAAPNPTIPAAETPPARPAPPGGAFRDPLVEALARGLARRGHDERRLRAAIREYVSRDGRRGEDGVRAELIGPLLDTLATELGGVQSGGGAPAPRPGQAAPPPSPRAASPGPARAPLPPPATTSSWPSPTRSSAAAAPGGTDRAGRRVRNGRRGVARPAP